MFGQTPHWIWPDRSEKTETVYFRKAMELPYGNIKKALLIATCDNSFSAHINGQPALAGNEWENKYAKDVTKLLTTGRNIIAVEGRNQGGHRWVCRPAGSNHQWQEKHTCYRHYLASNSLILRSMESRERR